MVTQQYRKATDIADVLDFCEDASKSTVARPGEFDKQISGLKSDLAEQERIDGKPADPRKERQGFLGAT